jgi:probable F420-dependent oxidoreductase
MPSRSPSAALTETCLENSPLHGGARDITMALQRGGAGFSRRQHMQIGVFYFPVDYGIDIAELARALEERGFESLFVPEHTHIPVSRRSPFPGGGELPKRYAHTHDPFVALSFAAAVTKTLMLGTGIALIPERDPIVTAKCVASLDQLSGGRFIFGIGGGWNVEEMENHGARYNTRFKLMRERILAMKALWAEEEAEYHGEMVDFDKVWSWPKPVQKPHPPIILGGETDYTLRRVVEYCDGWFPRPGRGFEIAEQLKRLRCIAEEKGRDPKTLSTSVFRAPPDKATLKEYEAAGIDRAVLEIPDQSRDEILRVLDRYAPLLA